MTYLDTFFNRPVGIFDFALSHDPAECAKLAKQHGFSCIQWGFPFSNAPEQNTRAYAEECSRILQGEGLEVVAISGYQNIVSVDPQDKAAALNKLETDIEIASVFPHATGIATETGTKNQESPWVGHPDNLGEAAWEEMVESLQRLGEKAKAAGTRILIEGYVENVVRTADDLEKLLSVLDMEAFGFVMDPFNLILEETLPHLAEETGRIFNLMNGHVGIAHAKDLLYTDGVVDTPRSGKGMFDFQTYFKLLDEKLPGVPLILEHLNADEVSETLDFLKSQYEQTQDT